MKKSSFATTIEHFASNMRDDITFLVKVDAAKRTVISLREKRDLFEAYVFRIFANWEILVQTLLVDCLNRDTARYSEFTGFEIRKHVSRAMCKAMIMGTRYVDFRSTDHLKGEAKKILVPKYNPFQRIPKPRGKKIDEFFAFRNYLAHYSDAAQRALEKIYKSRHGLRTFREPGVFLLSPNKGARIPKMATYIKNFSETGAIMARFLGVKLI